MGSSLGAIVLLMPAVAAANCETRSRDFGWEEIGTVTIVDAVRSHVCASSTSRPVEGGLFGSFRHSVTSECLADGTERRTVHFQTQLQRLEATDDAGCRVTERKYLTTGRRARWEDEYYSVRRASCADFLRLIGRECGAKD